MPRRNTLICFCAAFIGAQAWFSSLEASADGAWKERTQVVWSKQSGALIRKNFRVWDPHPEFKREGQDLLLELPIAIDEAVLGARIEVPTATGRVQLTIPKGTSSGTVFRLRGKGVRSMTTGASGDQLVTVRIVLPQTIDEKLSYFMSEWRQKHAYDPRSKT